MRIATRLAALTFVATCLSSRASAQDRPFLFSVSTPRPDQPRVTAHVDAGVGEHPFDLVEGEQSEQRFGLQASFGNGVTVLARFGVANGGGSPRTSQQAELLYSVVRMPAHQGSVAVGMGMRHEASGTNVLLGRVAAGRGFLDVWRLDGNAIFEKPLAGVRNAVDTRDSVDLITTVGVARQVTSAVHVGVELIGEDLEGFWSSDETEGGARLLAGPSIRIAPRSQRWQASVAGGPVVHATHSAARSDATRSLPVTNRDGYAVRASLTYSF